MGKFLQRLSDDLLGQLDAKAGILNIPRNALVIDYIIEGLARDREFELREEIKRLQGLVVKLATVHAERVGENVLG